MKSVRLLDKPPAFMSFSKATGARRRGVLYEWKVLEKLAEAVIGKPELTLIKHPWFEFWDENGRHWCQPDALLLGLEQNLIYEVKYKHCAEAWFQLWRLYVPVLEKWAGSAGKKWQGIEVVKWHDPATNFPEKYSLAADILEIPRNGRTAVHIWNPARD